MLNKPIPHYEPTDEELARDWMGDNYVPPKAPKQKPAKRVFGKRKSD